MELPDISDVIRKWDHMIADILADSLKRYLMDDIIVLLLRLFVYLQLFGEVEDMAVGVSVQHI